MTAHSQTTSNASRAFRLSDESKISECVSASLRVSSRAQGSGLECSGYGEKAVAESPRTRVVGPLDCG